MNFNYSHKKKSDTEDFEIIITGDKEAWEVLNKIKAFLGLGIARAVKELIKETKTKN